MSNITFSQLPDIGNGIINGAIIPIVQNGVNYTVTAQEIGNYVATVNPSNYGNSNVADYLPTYTGNILSGNISVTANVAAGNVSTVGNIVTAGYFIGDGGLLSNIAGGGYGNTQVAEFLPTYTGNILAGNLSITGNTVIIGNIDGGNLRTAGLVSATGNLHGGNVNTGGLVSATGGLFSSTVISSAGSIRAGTIVSAIGNIDGGNLRTAGLITATGNVQGGNIRTAGLITATGNIQGNVFIGNGAGLTSLLPTTIVSGTSNVQFSGSGGNLLFNVGGTLVGNISQNSVYLGQQTGRNPTGLQCVGIGYQAAQSAQGSGAVAIGLTAGQSSQGTFAIAIGSGAGSSAQGAVAIAIGQDAGSTNQGANAIAIGFAAGITNQHDSSIVINATGTSVDSPAASTTVIKPMRGDTTTNLLANGFTGVYYNASSGELCYSTGA